MLICQKLNIPHFFSSQIVLEELFELKNQREKHTTNDGSTDAEEWKGKEIRFAHSTSLAIQTHSWNWSVFRLDNALFCALVLQAHLLAAGLVPTKHLLAGELT